MKPIKTKRTNQFMIVSNEISKDGVSPSITTLHKNFIYRHICFKLGFKEHLKIIFGFSNIWVTVSSPNNINTPYFKVEVKNENELLKGKFIYNEIKKTT